MLQRAVGRASRIVIFLFADVRMSCSNAAYAADGYSRCKEAQANSSVDGANGKVQGGVRGLGCLLTTFGVGEL